MPISFEPGTGSSPVLQSIGGTAADPGRVHQEYLIAVALDDTMEGLQRLASSYETRQRAAFEATQSGVDDYRNVRSAPEGYIERCRRDNVPVDPQHLDYLKGQVPKARERLDAINAQAHQATINSAAHRDYHASALALTASMARSKATVRFIDMELPEDSKALRELVEHQQGVEAELRAEAKAVEKAPMGREEAEAALLADLDRVIAEAMPKCSFGKRPRLLWPIEVTGGTPAHDRAETPHVRQALPLAAFVARKALAEHIKASAAAYYADEPLALSEREKTTRLGDIDDQILQAHRVECAALWALQAAGHDVPFRSGLHIKAVLGIA